MPCRETARPIVAESPRGRYVHRRWSATDDRYAPHAGQRQSPCRHPRQKGVTTSISRTDALPIRASIRRKSAPVGRQKQLIADLARTTANAVSRASDTAARPPGRCTALPGRRGGINLRRQKSHGRCVQTWSTRAQRHWSRIQRARMKLNGVPAALALDSRGWDRMNCMSNLVSWELRLVNGRTFAPNSLPGQRRRHRASRFKPLRRRSVVSAQRSAVPGWPWPPELRLRLPRWPQLPQVTPTKRRPQRARWPP